MRILYICINKLHWAGRTKPHRSFMFPKNTDFYYFLSSIWYFTLLWSVYTWKYKPPWTYQYHSALVTSQTHCGRGEGWGGGWAGRVNGVKDEEMRGNEVSDEKRMAKAPAELWERRRVSRREERESEGKLKVREREKEWKWGLRWWIIRENEGRGEREYMKREVSERESEGKWGWRWGKVNENEGEGEEEWGKMGIEERESERKWGF